MGTRLPIRLLVQQLNQVNRKGTSKLCITDPLWGGIYRWPVGFLYKGPVMRKDFPCHDVIIMAVHWCFNLLTWICWIDSTIFEFLSHITPVYIYNLCWWNYLCVAKNVQRCSDEDLSYWYTICILGSERTSIGYIYLTHCPLQDI